MKSPSFGQKSETKTLKYRTNTEYRLWFRFKWHICMYICEYIWLPRNLNAILHLVKSKSAQKFKVQTLPESVLTILSKPNTEKKSYFKDHLLPSIISVALQRM